MLRPQNEYEWPGGLNGHRLVDFGIGEVKVEFV